MNEFETECLVMKLGLLGKHQKHDPHDWWYTSKGGGHQLPDDYEPDVLVSLRDGWDRTEHWVTRHHCPGN
jgi:hypothetical protein